MRKIKTLFTDSFHELRDLKNLTAAALLLAISVVLGFYRLQATEYLRIGFDFIAKELTAMMFGPAVGCMAGGLADILSYVVKPTGGFFPGFTISAMAGGVLYGLLLYKKPLRIWRVIAANSLVTVLVNLLLNTYWLTLLYGDAFAALLPARAVKQILTLPVEVILFYAVAKTLRKTGLSVTAGREPQS